MTAPFDYYLKDKPALRNDDNYLDIHEGAKLPVKDASSILFE